MTNPHNWCWNRTPTAIEFSEIRTPRQRVDAVSCCWVDFSLVRTAAARKVISARMRFRCRRRSRGSCDRREQDFASPTVASRNCIWFILEVCSVGHLHRYGPYTKRCFGFDLHFFFFFFFFLLACQPNGDDEVEIRCLHSCLSRTMSIASFSSVVNDSSRLVYYWSTSCMDDLCCVFPAPGI